MRYELLNYLIACTAQVGMTPEEVVSKIMANPDVAVAFQNPKIQTAIMDVRPCRNSSIILLCHLSLLTWCQLDAVLAEPS